MKQRKYLAVCTAAMLLLTGCGGNKSSNDSSSNHNSSREETVNAEDSKQSSSNGQIKLEEGGKLDLSAKYPEFFQYSFGKDASFQYENTYLENGVNVEESYQLSFYDKNGNQYFRPYAVGNQLVHCVLGSAEKGYQSNLEVITEDCMDAVFQQDFYESVVKKYLENASCDRNSIRPIGVRDDPDIMTFSCSVINSVSLFQSDSATLDRLATAHITPETGWKVCDTDWKSIASDEEWLLEIEMNLRRKADPEVYKEKLEAMIEEYASASDQPVSYTVQLTQDWSDTEDKMIWQKTVILGEEVVREDEDMRFEFEVDRARQDIAAQLYEKHRFD